MSAEMNYMMKRIAIRLGGVLAVTCMLGAPATAAEANLAFVAQPSISLVAGKATLEALNDGFEPVNSQDRSRKSCDTWPGKGTQWMQYDWSQPVSTAKIDVYWVDDRDRIWRPKACRLLYWDGKAFVPVGNPAGLGVAENQFNTTTFDEVLATKLRLEIDADREFSTGILEWKVYDTGKSPAFPPLVAAGIDRVVVLGGETYLTGDLKVVCKQDVAATAITWSKVSGPGAVTFAAAAAPVTTARFAAAGDYVLQLTANKGPWSRSSRLAVKVVAPPPRQHLEPVTTMPYKIDSPLWTSRAKALIVNWIPHCISKLSTIGMNEGGIENFLNAAAKLAGKPQGGHRGYPWANAWVYNTVESICIALEVDPQGDQEIIAAQQAMKATLADWIPKIIAAQEPDGYLQTEVTLSGKGRWSSQNRTGHEGYNAAYFLEAGIAHYLMTNKSDDRLYRAAKKLADCWYDNLGPAPKKPWHDGHQAMELALVRFGRLVNQVEGAGQGAKYIGLAKFLLDNRNGGLPYDQSHLPVIRQYEAEGHAVRALYSYAGMAGVAMETGDVDYQSAVMSLWDNIVNRKYYVTGGVGSGETSEGFGPNYSLRHNGYCEACSSCGEIFLQHTLHLMYHDAKYADLYEETLYNALLGSIDLDGRNFYYQNPLDSQRARYPWHVCPCCVGNIPRVLLMLPTWMYSTGADSIYVNLFVGSSVTVKDVAGTAVTLVQATDYPWSGKVSITVNPVAEKTFSLRVRVPRRDVSGLYTAVPAANGITSIALNGSVITPPVDNGYAVITRKWAAGDKIELVLPMKVQRIKGSEKIAATRGQVAVRYGPLVYCAESVDQNLAKAIGDGCALQTEWQGDLLGGVQVIKGSWADGAPLTLIPYYTRNNRGGGGAAGTNIPRATVWLQDQRGNK